MVKYNDRIKKGKLGVNYVTDIVDRCECYFNKIEQENDIGIDGIIELVEDSLPTGKCIAVQIKTGGSYVNKRKCECRIPIDNHYEYWKNYSMPVYGVVYDLDDNIAYWVDIKKYLVKIKNDIELGKLSDIKYKMKNIHRFDIESFNKYFKSNVMNTLPKVNYEEAMDLLKSENIDEIYIAINVLGRRYADRIETWDKFMNLFKSFTNHNLLEELIFYFSYIPHHGDLCGDLNFSKQSKEYAKKLISELKIEQVIKLLQVIDENGIQRGTIGQCVEAIIASVINSNKILKEII